MLRLLGVLALVAPAAIGWAASPPSHASALYVRYCASCHGVSGTGDGPAAVAMTTMPTDLTTSCASKADLMKVIDGTRTIRAHGDAKMPVWGHVFEQAHEGETRQHRQALRDVEALAEYVQHLCAKR